MSAQRVESNREPGRWARVHAGSHTGYPVHYRNQWLRVIERPNPDVPSMPGYIWLDLAGKAQQVQAEHFEIVERTRRRILVVDDETGIRQTLQIALRNLGYEVLQSPDGEDATRLWREWGPDLIVADIHMPKKSGLLLMQDLQANGSSTRIIAMTDGGPARRMELMGLASLLGAVRTIAKPFTIDDMLKLVDQELHS